MPSKKIEMNDLIAKFKAKNRNREPRDANELVKFSKTLRGFQPISFGEARKYLQSASASTPRRRRPRPKPESKEPEEKESTEEPPSSPQPDGSATEMDEVDSTPYQVGDEVLLTKERTGIIRFIGPVEFTEGTVFGIELHSQFVGTCDGSKNGQRYFECGPQRGLFVPQKKIRRKMTKSDHARKTSWLAANAERNSRVGRTPSPGPPPIDEEQEQEQQPPPPATEETDDPPATEEKEDSQDVAEEVEAVETNEEEVKNDNENEDDEEQQAQDAPPEEVDPPADEENADEEVAVDDEQPPPEDTEEPAAEVYEEKEEDLAESPYPQTDEEQTLAPPAEAARPSRQSYNLDQDFYPAKGGENLLQFVANQPDLALRGQLMDAYMTSKDVERLERAFEQLKAFSPEEQNNLLRVDILPRLSDCQ